MGFCYEVTGGKRILCCDRCGHAGGCRKVRCKFGYCQANALCAACRAEPGLLASIRAHCTEHCKPAAEEYAAKRAVEAAVLATGAFIFCAAINAGRRVRLTFRNAAGDTKDAVVERSVYERVRASGRTTTIEEAIA